ncbi:hypothetical protein [Candidatus Paracaedibacter symbiosus]|uniref:hypothetical protein n=1 Tax=Candidatus Paracaedibacter symbiosus TaxID=244582 RepID=UPI000509701F|nr:hypothetical protein [Candidatus Paracaedibacter symbiosus]
MYIKSHGNFEKWIDGYIKNGSQVYFPAISYEPIKAFEEILPIHPESYNPYPSWGERKYTSEDYTSHPFPEFIKALEVINDDFRLYFLSVNPTHDSGPGGTVRLTNATTREEKEKETNTDSLVLKIAYGNAHTVLPGDATGITTSRIQVTYSPGFLRSQVLLLAHHGAYTEGSNNDVWLGLIQPEYILISAGHTYGHPHKKALRAFRSLASLKKNITNHQISWTKRGTHRDKEDTTDAIFLTYDSGDLATELFINGTVKLITQIEGKIKEAVEEEAPTKSPEEEKEEEEEEEKSASQNLSSSREKRKK